MTTTRQLYIASNHIENFRILVLARTTEYKLETDAAKIVKEWATDNNMNRGTWELKPVYITDIHHEHFDADYTIARADDNDDLAYITDIENYLSGLTWNAVNLVCNSQELTHENDFTLFLRVAPCVSIDESIKLACTEYCLTKEGRKTYIGNSRCFNWGDFALCVPNDICRKYGILKGDDHPSEFRNADEQLVNETDIFPEE